MASATSSSNVDVTHTSHVKEIDTKKEEKVDYLNLPCPIPYEEIHREALKTGFGYGEWLHGEAVAAGTVMAVDMSYRLGWIDESIVKRVYNILQQAKLPTAPPPGIMTVEMFKSVMAVDKKVADGLLRLILLKGPLGNCVFTGDYDRKVLDETLVAFCKS